MKDELEFEEDVVAEDSEELQEGSSEAGADLERLEMLERHGMLTHAADINALEAHREKHGKHEADDEEEDGE